MNIVDVSQIDRSAMENYDRAHFPVPRPKFLKLWINQAHSHAKAFYKAGTLQGYGVIRACREGHKIGPLFANDAITAEALFQSLTSCVTGEPVFLDVPERNDSAMNLVREHQMTELFGCAKMFDGDEPELPHDQSYGVTTFELG